MNKEKPVYLPQTEAVYAVPDMFRHEPLAVRINSADLTLHRDTPFVTRFLTRDKIYIESASPLDEENPFHTGRDILLKVFFPFEKKGTRLTGKVCFVAKKVRGQDDMWVGVVGITLGKLDLDVRKKIEAHDLIVQTVQNRHRPTRLPTHFEVKVQKEGGKAFQAQLFDLSMTGAFFETEGSLEEGESLSILFRLPFQKEYHEIIAKVVWAGEKKVESETGLYRAGYGIRFEAAQPPARYALAQYCSKYSLFCR